MLYRLVQLLGKFCVLHLSTLHIFVAFFRVSCLSNSLSGYLEQKFAVALYPCSWILSFAFACASSNLCRLQTTDTGILNLQKSNQKEIKCSLSRQVLFYSSTYNSTRSASLSTTHFGA